MSGDILNFSEGFSGGTEEAWLAMVEKTLRGKPFGKAMQRETYDGIKIDAISTQQSSNIDAQPKRHPGEWAIVSPNWATNPEQVNSDILEDLERGASAIAITMGEHLKECDLSKALHGVYLDMVPFILIQNGAFTGPADAMMRILHERDHRKQDLKGTLGLDPIGTFARAGCAHEHLETLIKSATKYAVECSQQFPSVSAFVADGTVYANAGAPSSIEIASALSAAVAYLRSMEAESMTLESAARNIQFTLSADADLWVTIAKFRALRRLWASILGACGVKGIPAHINAVSAVYMSTRRDPWVNILRGTAACFAAGVGGADTITTLPHDLMLGTTNKFSRRIARNIQITLIEESSLAKVADPAAGSYALETLTNDMTQTAEARFRKLEAEGGVLSALRAGTLQSDIETAAHSREKNIRTRKQPITGVSEFPNIDESPLPIMPTDDTGNLVSNPDHVEQIKPLPLRGLATAYELLRAKSDAFAGQVGTQPSIFLANMGTPADFTARATFAKNFFEAGGIRGLPGAGTLEANELAADFRTSGAKIAVICGSDTFYSEHALIFIQTLKDAGCQRIYLAGRPENIDVLHEAGLDEIIFMGCDVIDVLEGALAVYTTEEGGVS